MNALEAINAISACTLSPSEKMLLTMIAMRAGGDEGVSYQSVPTYMQQTGIKSKRTVQGHLLRFLELGILTAEEHSGWETHYRFVSSWLEAHALEAQRIRDERREKGRGSPPTPATIAPPPATIAEGNHCTPATTAGVPRQPLPGTPATIADDQTYKNHSKTIDDEADRARPPPGGAQGPALVAEHVKQLLTLQHQELPDLEADPRDGAQLRWAFAQEWTRADFDLLWAWSGLSSDKDAEASRNSGWRRFKSLLKPENAESRRQAARAWDAAGRPSGKPATRATGPPARASPPPEDPLHKLVRESRERRAAAGLPPLLQEMTHGK